MSRTDTHPTSPTLIECRGFGFTRVIVAGGVLKCLPTAVRGGTNTSFLQTVGLELHPSLLPLSSPSSFFFSVGEQGL